MSARHTLPRIHELVYIFHGLWVDALIAQVDDSQKISRVLVEQDMTTALDEK